MKVSVDFELTSEEAFRTLCKTLYMECVLDEDTEYFIKTEDEKNKVYARKNGKEVLYDERGDLFIALRNVAVNMFPNTSFRGDSYIYNS